MLLTYLEGEDLSGVLPALSPKGQLNLGVEAGRLVGSAFFRINFAQSLFD
jgi:hypothetical protein